MKPLLVFVVLLLLFGLVAPHVARALVRAREGREDWPFGFRTPLSRVEQVLYFRLAQALPDLVVLAQVPLTSFLRVRRGRTWREWFNRISQKSVDFLVCERDFSVVIAIELDDRSHDASDRAQADKTKSRALTAAGVRLVRWRVDALPDVGTIRRIVDEIRDDGERRDGVVSLEPPLAASRVDASNDASIFQDRSRS